MSANFQQKMSTRSNNEQLSWTRSELLRAIKENKVAGIAAVGLTVQFVLKPGDCRGIVVQYDGSIKRFRSDSAAWQFVADLK